jgi:hypothetical protein
MSSCFPQRRSHITVTNSDTTIFVNSTSAFLFESLFEFVIVFMYVFAIASALYFLTMFVVARTCCLQHKSDTTFIYVVGSAVARDARFLLYHTR